MKKETFKEHYEKLESIYKKLENEEVDLDMLIPLVEDATSSVKYCKDRLNSVKKTLNDKLNLNDE